MVLIVFFCGFCRRVLKWLCILYMRMNSHSHLLQLFFPILSLCDVNHFHVGWGALLKGFNVTMVRLECTSHPLTLFEKHNWKVCFNVDLEWSNKCSQIILHKSSPAQFFVVVVLVLVVVVLWLGKNRQATYLHFLFVLYQLFLFHRQQKIY